MLNSRKRIEIVTKPINIEEYINAFLCEKYSLKDMLEVLDGSNEYKYYNEIYTLNYPLIYNVKEEDKTISLFNKIMDMCIENNVKVYIYMNSFFKLFIGLEDFIGRLLGEKLYTEKLCDEFRFYKFYGQVVQITEGYIDVKPKYIASKGVVRIVKKLEPDDEWMKIKIGDLVKYDLKEILRNHIYGKTIKKVEEVEGNEDMLQWEIYSRILLKVLISKGLSRNSRIYLMNMRQIDLRKIRKIAKNQELVIQCINNLKSVNDVVSLIELLGDKNSFKYDEVRSKLCYKPNGKDVDGKIRILLENIFESGLSVENKVFIYMNSPLKTMVSVEEFFCGLLEREVSNYDLERAFEKYKFYGKVIYSTGNEVKIKPTTMFSCGTISVDKRMEPIIKKVNVKISSKIIYKFKKYNKEKEEIKIQIIGYV